MCGIFSIFLKNPAAAGGSELFRYGGRTESLRELAFRQSSKQRHRGPDYTGLVVDMDAGQPFVSEDGTVLLTANGEIYNYRQMAEAVNGVRKAGDGEYVPRSDCDVIIAYYEQFGAEKLMETIRGMFAFVLYDKKTDHVLVARDPIGIIPLV
ncbi:asparagine synthetase [Culex quinquefasciatus]|uniref:Asparagine synthetase n=1 Tax=Culex quinquefasciatus TaxID=7176 RepID=B0XK43_CULQU|nr:asparagine synthetase [Culex quinquefasciatus]|eukprot:XP_001870015.1 asparagine synthetase [Culex quinquefasciatus]